MSDGDDDDSQDNLLRTDNKEREEQYLLSLLDKHIFDKDDNDDSGTPAHHNIDCQNYDTNALDLLHQ